MARHAVNADEAFDMLRHHSQHNGRKLVEIAEAIVESHLLLATRVPTPDQPPQPQPQPEA
jgi:hypothetical protein